MKIEFDDSQFPIVQSWIPAEVTIQDLDEYFDAMVALFQARGAFLPVTDLSAFAMSSSAAQRKRAAERADELVAMGGNIAGAYASRYPKDLKSLLLIAPGGVASSEPSEMFRRLKEGKPNPLVAESVEDYERLLDFVFNLVHRESCRYKLYRDEAAVKKDQQQKNDTYRYFPFLINHFLPPEDGLPFLL